MARELSNLLLVFDNGLVDGRGFIYIYCTVCNCDLVWTTVWAVDSSIKMPGGRGLHNWKYMLLSITTAILSTFE